MPRFATEIKPGYQVYQKMLNIDSSLNDSLENLKVLRLHKIMIAFGVIPNEFGGWGSMRQTKCDQNQGNWTLGVGVRGQIEGKVGTFGCNSFFD